MASEIKVDTISEKTSANGVTIDGVLIKDNKLASGIGNVLQVVTGTTTTDSGAIASTSFTDTGLTADITPSATSSKILVVVQQTLNAERDSAAEISGFVNIMRDTTEVGEWTFTGGAHGNQIQQSPLMYMDSPSSTSALTYKTQIKASTTANGGKVRANQQSSGTESPSSIQLIEIGA